MKNETISFSGKAHVAHGGNKEHGGKVEKGAQMFALVDFSVRGFNEVQTQSAGDENKLLARLGEVIILKGSEAKEAKARLADQREKREGDVGEGQQRIDGPEVT